MIRVAVVEDDADLLDDVAFSLRDEGLLVTPCVDGRALDRHLAAECLDVLVLDIGLPGEDGRSIARRLRRDQPRLGIVMLTARTMVRDRVQGMEDGADVYMCKPVDLRELALVIRALARRLGGEDAPVTQVLSLIASENLLITPTGQRIELTPNESLVLSRLSRAAGGQATRRQIIEAFGERYMEYDERRLETIVSRMRKKLEAAGLSADTVRAVRGVGYVLQVPLQERLGRRMGHAAPTLPVE
jgi:two-component system OmpR family response regulator